MTQLHLGLNLSTERMRKRDFLDEMRRVIPWSNYIALVKPHYPKGKTGRPPFPVALMLQIYYMQQGFRPLDSAMEEALYDVPLYLEFWGLDGGMARLPDEITKLRFRYPCEAHGIAVQMLAPVNEILVDKGLMLKAGSAVDATLIAAPSSTMDGSSKRDPELAPTQKGRNWYFGMKAHVCVDAESGLVHTVIGTAENVHDINAARALLHGEETDVYANAGYQGLEKREQARPVRWDVAMRAERGLISNPHPCRRNQIFAGPDVDGARLIILIVCSSNSPPVRLRKTIDCAWTASLTTLYQVGRTAGVCGPSRTRRCLRPCSDIGIPNVCIAMTKDHVLP